MVAPTFEIRSEIRYYAQLRDALKTPREEAVFRLPATEDQLLRQIADLHPQMEKVILASRVVINDEYLPRGAVLGELRGFDLISPVSGG